MDVEKKMEILVKVGYSRKVGTVNYGSEGATCGIECPANIAMIGSPGELEQLIAQLYRSCVDAVETQLANTRKPQDPAPVPPPEPPKTKSSVFGLWLKDRAVAYGQAMPALTGLLYRHLVPGGLAVDWTQQGRELAGLWDKAGDPEKEFDAHLVKSFESLESAD